MASISPRFMAATAVGPAPTRMNEASSAFRPFFTIRYMTKKLVEEPGAVTPIFMPLRSAKPLDLRGLVLLDRQARCRGSGRARSPP